MTAFVKWTLLGFSIFVGAFLAYRHIPINRTEGLYYGSPLILTGDGYLRVEVRDHRLYVLDLPKIGERKLLGSLKKSQSHQGAWDCISLGNSPNADGVTSGTPRFTCKFRIGGVEFFDDEGKYRGFGWRGM